ncbi:hypothetical protein ACG873_29545 [Mesorhizobium sp. AaZ16]|uniref:hypothetical protein n=1 Tax=Mesorhizobium sp. AaZ16 TaxID=3402289 RepID=UPI00374EEC03
MSTTTNKSPSIDRAALIYCIKRATLLVGAALLEVTQLKAGFRSDQPRVPARNPDGSQWADEDGDADLLLVQGEPNEFPEVPEDPPPTTRERNSIAVRIATFLLATNSAVQADRVSRWVWEHARDRIVAYLDEPKFLDELRRAAGEPKPGYETPARQDGYATERIQGWRNLVRIPTYRHWQITGWYATKNPRYGWMSPRDYLRGKSWSERHAVGLEALRLFGVLK